MSEPTNGRAHGAPVRVLRVGEGEACIVLFLGPMIGHLEHWTPKASLPCLGEEECERGRHRLRLVFYAYAPVGVFDPKDGSCSPAVLQLTSNLEEQLRGQQLRGQVWSLARDQKRGKHGKVEGVFIEQRDPDTVPAAFPILAPLQRLFKEMKLRLGVANPNPAPLIIEDFAVEPLRLGRFANQEQTPTPPTPEQLERLRAQFRRAPSGNGRK